MINIQDFDSSLIKIDKKSCKNIGIYNIGYIAIKNDDYENIGSVNPLCLIVGKADGYNKWNKVFTFQFYRWKLKSISKIYKTLE